jgi:hypothetical protein
MVNEPLAHCVQLNFHHGSNADQFIYLFMRQLMVRGRRWDYCNDKKGEPGFASDCTLSTIAHTDVTTVEWDSFDAYD